MVPNGWTLIKLKDIGKCITGLTYSPKNVVNDGLLVLRSSNIQDSKLSFNDNVYVDIEVDKKSKTQFGDILLCVRNGSKNLIGKSAFIYKENEQLAHGAFMSLFRSNETPDYTFQLFQSSQFFRQVNQNLGATINSINSGNLYQFKFPYPPFKEREKIAKILSTWDKAISTTERLIDNSKQQKKALMQQLLTGKKRLLDDSGKPFEGEWEEVKLKECATCLDNKRIPLNSSQRQEMQGEIPYWGANGIVDYVNEHIFDETIVLLAEDGGYFDEFSHRPIANISYGKSWVNNHAHILKAKNNSLNEWLYYSLVHKNILAFINGGTRAKLNKSDMLLIPINLPPIVEQTKIVRVLGNADQEISLLEQQLADLKQEKKALMQQLLTGKRRVTVS